MRLGAFLINTGHHLKSWRHPQAQADAGVNIRHYVDTAQPPENLGRPRPASRHSGRKAGEK